MDPASERYSAVINTLSGYLKTNTWLVGFDGGKYMPAGNSDDVGIFYLVPKLVSMFGVDIDAAFRLYYLLTTGVPLLLGLAGFWLYFQNKTHMVFAFFWTAVLGFLSFHYQGVCIMPIGVTLGTIPLWLAFTKERTFSIRLLVLSLFTGIFIGVAHFIRFFSGFPVLLFVFVVIALYLNTPWRLKSTLILTTLFGLSLPFFFFHSLMAKRDHFLKQAGADISVGQKHHVFWHTAYVGLGFLSNPYGLAFDDRCATEYVKTVAPESQYRVIDSERVLKKGVFSIIKDHPYFVVKTIFAKLGIYLMYLLVFLNVEFFNFMRKPVDSALDTGLWAGAGASALYGFVAVPDLSYSLGFVSFCVILGLVRRKSRSATNLDAANLHRRSV